MVRLVAISVLLAVAALAADVKLYLTDGTYHIVREYEVQSDRVRFYSTERSQWEEIPLELIDLKRTESEIRGREQEESAEDEFWEREEAAERVERREIARVPRETGVYLVEDGEFRTVPQATLEVVTDKKRALLKIFSPAPIVPGKQTVWIAGEHAPTVVASATPRFYIRLNREERFGIIRLREDEERRQVEQWTILPASDEVVEGHTDVPTLRRQVGYNLYQVWPEAPLEPGEYAVMEFAPGESNIQVWDFSYAGGGGTDAGQ